MVASQAVMQQTPDDVVLEMSADMKACAESGNWEKVEELSARLKKAVMAVPEDRRRDALLAARRCTEQVQALARDARSEVTGKLSAIRRGQDATKAYAFAD